MKHRENGFKGYTYYTCGYGPRFSDWTGQAVSLVPGKAFDAADKAAEFEVADLLTYCDTSCGDCSFCCPDVTVGMETAHYAGDLFSARELMRARRDLLAGEVVWLDR